VYNTLSQIQQDKLQNELKGNTREFNREHYWRGQVKLTTQAQAHGLPWSC